MSKQRNEILQVIRNSDRHMTADEIFMECRAQGVQVSVATVYRNLGILAEEGELLRIHVAGKPDRFDKTVQEHEHVICECCGMAADVHMPGLKAYLEQAVGVALTGYDLSLRYICPACRNKKAV